MEDLTKHQLILIVLLITFVTSIATGIITFTLLQEAPVEVTQTINRVVEKTIERVVPAEAGQPEKVVTTVVVNEEDRVLDSISKVEKSLVRLKTMGADGSAIVSGLGLVISPAGVIVADERSYSATTAYTIVFNDGKEFPIGKVYFDDARGLVFLKVAPPAADLKYVFSPAALGVSDGVKIGQTLVAISGKDSNAASIGRVFQLVMAEDKKTVKNIISDIKITKSHPGSPAVNLSGEVVGLEAPFGEADSQYSFVPVSVIRAATAKALEELAK